MPKTVYVFAYDIADNRRRRRIASLLENHGLRVQESVFEIRTSRRRAQDLAKQVGRCMEAPDSLRVYPILAAARKNSIMIGGAPLIEEGDFYLF